MHINVLDISYFWWLVGIATTISQVIGIDAKSRLYLRDFDKIWYTNLSFPSFLPFILFYHLFLSSDCSLPPARLHPTNAALESCYQIQMWQMSNVTVVTIFCCHNYQMSQLSHCHMHIKFIIAPLSPLSFIIWPRSSPPHSTLPPAALHDPPSRCRSHSQCSLSPSDDPTSGWSKKWHQIPASGIACMDSWFFSLSQGDKP